MAVRPTMLIRVLLTLLYSISKIGYVQFPEPWANMALNSGMAAISNTLMAVAYSGSNIVTSLHLFGNTWSFIKNTLGAFGVEARFRDLTNPEEVKAQVDANTCAIFLEVITNPQLEVADLKAIIDRNEVYRRVMILARYLSYTITNGSFNLQPFTSKLDMNMG